MNSTNQGLKFGFFDDLGPEDQEFLLNSLRSGSARLELYWEKPATRIKCHLPRASIATTKTNLTTTATQTLDAGLHNKTEPEPAACRKDAGDGLPPPPPTSTESSNLPLEDPLEVSEPVIPETLKPELVKEETIPEEIEIASDIPAETVHPTDETGKPVQEPVRCDPPELPREKPMEEKVQAPVAVPIDAYYPHQVPDYLPPPIPTHTGAPGIHERSPPAHHPPPPPRPTHQHDYNVQRRSDVEPPQQVRGHVEDGIYTRPSNTTTQNLAPSPGAQSAQMNNSASKTYERRNKKRRPPDYYKRCEQENKVGPQVVQQVVGGYQVPAVSVRQAMESSPATAGYVGIPGTQQASVMSSQYGQHIPVSYPMITSMINPMHQQAVQQMQMFQRHQQSVQASTQQQYLVQQHQQEMARMIGATFNPYTLPHVAQNPVFHQQPPVGPGNHGNMGGMGQPPQGRPVAMSPSNISPSMAPPQMGRSPPRGPPMGTQQYPDPRPMDIHGYHPPHPQASPNVPLSVQQVAIQSLNPNNSYNQASANPVQKDVARTGGQRMPLMYSQPPQNIPNYGPPLPQPHGQMVQHVPHKPVVVAPPPPQPPPPPPPPAVVVPITAQSPPHKLDTQHQAMASGNQKPAAPSPQPDVNKPVSPEMKEQVPVTVEVQPPPQSCQGGDSGQTIQNAPLIGEGDGQAPIKIKNHNVNIVKDPVVDKESAPPMIKVGDNVSETKKDKDERTCIKASFSGTLTFGTVQDIATMNAQSSEVDPSFKQSEEAKKTESAPPNKASVIPKTAPKPQATPVVVSVETIKDVAEPVEEFHDAPLPPEDLKEKSVTVAATAVTSTSAGVTVTTPTSTVNVTNSSTSVLNNTPLTNSTPSSPPLTKEANNKQSETKVVEVPAPPVTEPVKPKMVWASLFKSESKPAPPSPAPELKPSPVNNTKPVRKSEEKDDKKTVPIDEDGKARKLGEFLSKYANKYSPVSLQPRGLYNRSNWCYINATLQALLGCPAFYQLMKAMPNFKPGSRGPTSTPVIDCISQFVNEFTEVPPQNLKYIEKASGKGPSRSNSDIRYGPPFEPVNVLKMLEVIQSSTSFKLGRQEDAEEFLGVLLNALHEEMVACINIIRNDDKTKENGDVAGNGSARDGTANDNEDDDDQWEQVGPKNKSVVTRSAKLSHSPISETFGGQLRSTVHQQGHKESCTLQPFFSLQLDIQNEKVTSVNEALEALASKETLHGYTNDNKQEVEAYRRYTMDELPPVLILHLKCFIYQKTGGVQKVSKQIDVPLELNIGKDLMSANAKSKYSQSKRVYELFSVVNHHGMRAIGGHYTADIYHQGIQNWVRVDDSTVSLVSQQKVLQYEQTRFPYLLYYRRRDLT